MSYKSSANSPRKTSRPARKPTTAKDRFAIRNRPAKPAKRPSQKPFHSEARKPAPKKLNCRAVSALTLEQILFKKRSIEDALESAYLKVKAQDKGLVHAICYGVLRQHGLLQRRLWKLFDQQPDDTHPRVQIILEIGIWQLAQGYAEHASIHESVDACEQIGVPRAKGFVNALLRRAQKEQQLGTPLIEDEPKYLLPEWLNNLIQARQFSQSLILNHHTRAPQLASQLPPLLQDIWPALVKTHTQQPPITIRLNPHRVNPETYFKQLKSLHLDCQLGQLPNSITIKKINQLDKLPGYQVGAFCVQDEAAQCAAHILKPEPNTRCLDACSAPGGKATHMQELTANALDLHLLEINEFRSRRLRENLGRLRANGKIFIGSATSPDSWWDGRSYQKIMLDVPCTGTGVMRRNPDIPWLRTKEDVIALSADSLKMLRRLWHTLASDGQLLFATCSVLAEENDCVIDQFLQQTQNAKLIEFETSLKHSNTLYGKQILPTEYTDSLYYCLLQKVAPISR